MLNHQWSGKSVCGGSLDGEYGGNVRNAASLFHTEITAAPTAVTNAAKIVSETH